MSDAPAKPADIFALVHADLDERNQKGLETYGRTLTAFDGRDTAQDLLEELLDAVMYQKKAMVERKAALEALDRLSELLWDMHPGDRVRAAADIEVIGRSLGRK